MTRLRGLSRRQEVRFFAELWRASPLHAGLWWLILALRALLPSAVTLCSGWVVARVIGAGATTAPLVVLGVAFTSMVALQPLHTAVGQLLGARMTDHQSDRLLRAATSPDGIAHLERPEHTNDLTAARDFELGIMGPPLSVAMDFIAGGLLDLLIGIVASLLLLGLAWWAPFVLLAGWGSTHWLLKESGVWKDRNTDEVRTAQRHADYSYRLAVDAGPAKEVRYFGLAGWVTERFISTRTKLYRMQYEATRLRERNVATCLLVVGAANVIVFVALATAVRDGSVSSSRALVLAQAAIGVGAIAFGGLNWALDGAAAPVAALDRLEPAMAVTGSLRAAGPASVGASSAASSTPSGAPGIEFRGVRFAYGSEDQRFVLDGLDLAIPAGTSMAIVGANGAGKTTLAKLLCRLYDPTGGALLIDGTPLTDIDASQWRRQVTAVFQDYVRFELSLRTNVAPAGAPDDVIRLALADAGAAHLADGDLDRILSKGYPGGTDLSGGQWQRIALARTLCAVRQGAQVVLLDEPTAQLDVRGEAEIFERILTATKGCTVVLVSHRFSTVRLADRIAVVEHGRVAEIGTHDELMEHHGGRYRSMFTMQAARFDEGLAEPEYDEQGEVISRVAL